MQGGVRLKSLALFVGLASIFLISAGCTAIAGNKADVQHEAQILKDLPYGPDARQKVDVYLPSQPKRTPIIVMVHGGGWRIGDKDNTQVVQNKAAHWLPQGFIFVSVNYRMLPEANPAQQAGDVAQSLKFIQANAAQWGGDASRLILMGHSAGAHIVALLSADPAHAPNGPLSPWRGTVVLDSAAMDVNAVMNRRHFRLYDEAFGANPAFWTAASPIAHLAPDAVPMFLVCSSRRTDSCPPNRAFVAKAKSLGVVAGIAEENKTHREINETLGEDPAYTALVDQFIGQVFGSSH